MRASDRSGSSISLAGRVLLVAGLVGCLVWGFELNRAWSVAAARSSIPIAGNPLFNVPNISTDDRLFSAVPVDGVFNLAKGDLFGLKKQEGPGLRYNFLSFDLRLETGDVQEVYFRGGAAGYYSLRLSPDPEESCGIYFSIGNAKESELLSSFGEGEPWKPSAGAWHHYKLIFSGSDFSLEVDRDRSFDFHDERFTKGGIFFLSAAGEPAIDNIAMEGEEGGELFQHAETFSAPPGARKGRWLAHPASGFALALLLAALFAGWFALPGRMGFFQGFRGILPCYTASILLAAARWIGLGEAPYWLAASIPFGLGLLWGVLRLPRLGIESPAKRGSLPRGGSRSLLLCVVLLLVGLGPAVHLLRTRLVWEVGDPPLQDQSLLEEEARFPGPVKLDLSNAWLPSKKDLVRDFRLEGEVLLEPESQMELFFRQGGFQKACLEISTLPDLGCGWIDSSPIHFLRASSRALDPLRPGVWTPVRVEVRGARIIGTVGGKPLPEWLNGKKGSGHLGFLVNKGKGKIRNVSIVPFEPEIASPPLLFLAREAGWLAGALILLWIGVVFLASVKSRDTWKAWACLDALPHLSFGLYPVFVYFGFKPSGLCLGVVCALALLGRMAVLMANGRRLSIFAMILAPFLMVASSVIYYLGAMEPEPVVLRMNNLKLHQFTPPIRPDMAWYQIPKLRRSNLYLIQHEFRDRVFSLEKPEGTFRIVCMGSSSTFGHGMPMGSGWDYPSELEKVLSKRMPGQRFEVLNAGIRGGDSAQVREFYSGVIRHFEPDLVIISLFNNDAFYQTISEEYPYLEEMAAASFDQGFFGRLAMELRVWRRASIYRKYYVPLQKGEEVPEGVREMFDRGVRSFKNLVSDIVERVLGDGGAVLLVKEPFRLGSRGEWSRDTYYRALGEVGREKGVPVVEPLEYWGDEGVDLKEIFIDFVHMNRKGNAVMAGFLADTILEQGIAPPR